MVVTKWDHTESPEDELLDLLTCHRSESWSVVYVSHLHLFSRLVFLGGFGCRKSTIGNQGQHIRLKLLLEIP
jgi:hypothetical protein